MGMYDLYKPREDSELLAKYVKKYSFGNVLDMGTGFGIQAVAATKCRRVKNVLGVDINKKAVAYCKKTCKNRKIRFIVSDLFKKIKKIKFDTIIFNPPYLPNDTKIKDIAVDGGKKGYEAIARFFENANEYLDENGIILLLFSTLTKKDKVDEIISSYLLEKELIGRQKLAFEELYVYKIAKKPVLKILEKKGINNIRKLAKGKRGIIFRGKYKSICIAAKIKREDSAADTIANEISKIQILNMYNIGPRFLFGGSNYFIYEYAPGEFILDFFRHAQRGDILFVLKDVFLQARAMDRLGINKEEMHHPLKHVVVNKKGGKIKVVLLDFERCKKTLKPHNVTQFCQFVVGRGLSSLLRKKGIRINRKKLLGLAKVYKDRLDDNSFQNIIKYINK